VQEFRSKQEVLGAAMNLAGSVAEMKSKDDAIRANAAHRESVMAYQKMAAENPTMTREQLDEWATENLDDPNAFDMIDTQAFDDRGEENIPMHVWYTAGLDQVMSKSREAAGANIASTAIRNSWSSVAEAADDKELARSVGQSAQAAVSFEVERTKTDVVEAIKSGDLEYASEMLTSEVWKNDPITKTVLQAELFRAQKDQQFSEMMIVAQESEDYDDVLSVVTSPEWGEGLSRDRVLQYAQSVVTQRKGAITQEKAETTAMQNANAMALMVGLNTGEATIHDVNANANIIGFDNLKTLTNFARTVASTPVISDPDVMRNLNMEIISLRAGLPGVYPGDNFQERVQAAQADVSNSLGERLLSSDDALKISEDLSKMKEFPFKTEEYTHTISELRDRILGVKEGGGFSLFATDESRAIFANSVNSLREYVENNGGVAADIGVWREQSMQGFLNSNSRAVLNNIPADIRNDIQYTATNDIDVALTREKAKTDLLNKKRLLDIGKINIDSYNNAVKRVDKINRWLDTWENTNAIAP
jgi:hypothetical protein